MDIQTIRWHVGRGWSAPLPELDGRETLVLVFADPTLTNHPDRPLQDALAHFAGACVLGCSTAGQLDGDSVSDDSVVVTVTRFETTRLSLASVDIAAAGGPRRCGRQIANALRDPQLRGVLMLSDGLGINASALAAGIADELPGIEISGGLAGDGERFADTWVLVRGEPRPGWVTAVGIAGADVEMHFGAASGWDAFGPDRVVTRSHGNVVYELDSRPALALYDEYLGGRGNALPASAHLLPLSVVDLDGRTSLRTVLAIDAPRQSIQFAGDVAQGSIVRLMQASNERLVEGARRAAAMAATGREQLAFAVSCVGRRMVLGQCTEDELDAVVETLRVGTSLVGFYGYGELSPANGRCDLHSQTMTITT
ncbi:MAG: FIST N-terminal domain-containing protein, partial [Ilumatobacteraceae bacterium]